MHNMANVQDMSIHDHSVYNVILYRFGFPSLLAFLYLYASHRYKRNRIKAYGRPLLLSCELNSKASQWFDLTVLMINYCSFYIFTILCFGSLSLGMMCFLCKLDSCIYCSVSIFCGLSAVFSKVWITIS